MTKKKSHLRRKTRNHKREKPQPKHNPLLAGSVVEDRVRIIIDPKDRTMDYTMPRKEAERLVEQGKLAVSSLGGYEATARYPNRENVE
jgi:hypothetical protein